MNEPMMTLKSAAGEAPVRRFALDHSERRISNQATPPLSGRRVPLWAVLLGVRST